MTASLTDYADLLEQLNARLRPRVAEMPPATQALLTQKGAITQRALDDLASLLSAARAQLDQYETLQQACRHWLNDFLVPLHLQSQDLHVHERVDTEDLREVIRAMRAILGEEGDDQAALPPTSED